MNTFGSLAWFRELDEEDFGTLLTHLQRQAKTVLAGGTLYRERYDREVRVNVMSALYTLREVPLDNSAASRKAHRLIFKHLTKLIEECAEFTHFKAKEFQSGRFVSRSKRYKKYSVKLVTQYRKEPAIRLFEGLELKSATTSNILNSRTPFASVNQSVHKISELVAVAKELPVTTEEDYFLDKVANDYLPTLITSAMNMKNTPAEYQKEAEQNFLTQLKVLDDKLKETSLNASNRALSEVKSQTQFMLDSVEPKQITGKLEL